MGENNSKKQGIIIRLIGGLYTVESPCGVFDCKPRGIFRKMGQPPYVGDNVLFTHENVITDILPRRNSIIRPALANLDQMVFVVSACKPAPNFTLLDKFIAVCRYKNIEPLILITKVDLDTSDKILNIYSRAGIRTIVVDYSNGASIDAVMAELTDKLSAFTGNSGVGKSTLLNALNKNWNIPTGEISEKLGRGKHTTRHAELYPLEKGGYIADTPGFSTFETNKYEIIKKDEIQRCFIEFEDYVDDCKFKDCSHTKEKGCAVIQAVKDGIIPESRHNSYCVMYEEAKEIKDWEL